jgi:predicted RNA-binding Zn ribbon-like protein
MNEQRRLPNRLDLVVDFVNTLDVEQGNDALSSPDALGAWLAEHGLGDALRELGSEDLAGAVRLREALRAAMLAHNGGPCDAQVARELEDVARRGALGVRFTDAQEMRLEPMQEGVEGALARLLVPIARAMADGTWMRVKACRAEDCHWAFYDRSRNRSGTWCDMAVCGNRTKVRAYRARSG